MPGTRAEKKPLSFSTTMRNPDRIAAFLNCILPYENMTLTNDVIHEIIKNCIKSRVYHTMPQMRDEHLREIYNDLDLEYSDEELERIVEISPQAHKEAGFDYGWPSRFDTFYKLTKEFGFLYYRMNEPIRVSNTGHMLIDAFNEDPVNEIKIQKVMLNALARYQSQNPFKQTLNRNVPLMLFLRVTTLLHADPDENDAGVYKKELPLFICWPDNDADALYRAIKDIRGSVGFNYSNEYIYQKCLTLLGGEGRENRFKISQICTESVDEYIRKLRSTGVVSLRGNGFFLDINSFEQDCVDYLLNVYGDFEDITDEMMYFVYMGEIDNQLLEIPGAPEDEQEDVKVKTLNTFATSRTKEQIFEELRKLSSGCASSDPVFMYINEPTRLEFLTSIALVQNFDGIRVIPNYSIDDEGLPTSTAGGGKADIECYDAEYDSYFEVTLMRGRQDQVNNEIVPIRRHLKEYLQSNPNSFSVFVAPNVHTDAREVASLYKVRENLDILTYDIEEFICVVDALERPSDMLTA